MATEIAIISPLYAGKLLPKSEKSEKSMRRRHGARDRVAAPDHRDDLLDQVREPEREQDLRDVTPARARGAEPVALDRGADEPARERREHERGPEPDPASELERKIRAEHEHARVREIEHAHHAEDRA